MTFVFLTPGQASRGGWGIGRGDAAGGICLEGIGGGGLRGGWSEVSCVAAGQCGGRKKGARRRLGYQEF